MLSRHQQSVNRAPELGTKLYQYVCSGRGTEPGPPFDGVGTVIEIKQIYVSAARAAHLDYAGAVDRFRAAQSLPVAERSADSMEMAIVDSRRRDVEVLLRESVREEEDS